MPQLSASTLKLFQECPRFNDAAVGARLWGKLDDCVILPDERLAPLDHKTRASAPDDVSYTQAYYQFQMDVYTLLLERNGDRTANAVSQRSVCLT